jgi:hypothetical protein
MLVPILITLIVMVFGWVYNGFSLIPKNLISYKIMSFGVILFWLTLIFYTVKLLMFLL